MQRESVQDYPRPPIVEAVPQKVQVLLHEFVVADSTNALRVLETTHPPSYYIPQEDCAMDYLEENDYQTVCEYKGIATYYDFKYQGTVIQNAAWSYHKPNPGYEEITDHLAFYAHKFTRCIVGEFDVETEGGDFYGGWVTPNILT